MPRIAVTGHLNLTPGSVPVVSHEIERVLSRIPPAELTGMSCIARGADSIFAQLVIDLGGTLEVVIPSEDYREAKVEPEHAPTFDDLRAKATTVHVMPFREAGRAAYDAANEFMLRTSDELIAVWDGHRGVDPGSTASAVESARRRGLPVRVIWPDGAAREADGPVAAPRHDVTGPRTTA